MRTLAIKKVMTALLRNLKVVKMANVSLQTTTADNLRGMMVELGGKEVFEGKGTQFDQCLNFLPPPQAAPQQ